MYVVLLFSNEHYMVSKTLCRTGESLTMMPTAHVYAGADVEVAATGTLTTTDVTKAIGGAGLNWTDLHASRSTNKTNLKLNL